MPAPQEPSNANNSSTIQQVDQDDDKKGANKEKTKEQMVIDYIKSKCTIDSPFQDLRDIGAALADNAGGVVDLELELLSGGLSNYSYKVSTTSIQRKKKHHDKPHTTNTENKFVTKSLYAKLACSYKVNFPDEAFSLTRTENEFQMMQIFQELAPPGSVAVPYFCGELLLGDGGGSMKLLVTEWSQAADDLFANQFIDGRTAVNLRTVKPLVDCLSSLHCHKLVSKNEMKSFNEEMRQFLDILQAMLVAILGGFFLQQDGTMMAPLDRVCALAMEYTKPKLDAMVEAYAHRKHDKECLTHGDFHVFNIMVAGGGVNNNNKTRKNNKPIKEDDETIIKEQKQQFDGKEDGKGGGRLVICDFELSVVSIPGKDLGTLFAFPLSCALAHSLMDGNTKKAQNIWTYLETVWDEYAVARKTKNDKNKSTRRTSNENNKSDDDSELAQIYRDCLTFCGLCMIAGYGLGIHMDFLPIVDDKDMVKVKESVGVVGLKCLMLGAGLGEDKDLSFTELQARKQSWVEEEMSMLAAAKRAC